jgi:hypothetical protein
MDVEEEGYKRKREKRPKQHVKNVPTLDPSVRGVEEGGGGTVRIDGIEVTCSCRETINATLREILATCIRTFGYNNSWKE